MTDIRFVPFLGMAALLLGFAAAPAQQPRAITLGEAVRMALEQNPDALIARIEHLKAEQGVSVAKGAFSPAAYAGSGLGYTSGIPQSVEGATPSVVQATGRMPIYNRTLRGRVREAESMAEAAQYSRAAREDEIAFEVASTYLDFERAGRRVDLLAERASQLERAEQVTVARVDEGRAIPLDLTRARLERARVDRELDAGRSEMELLEATLRTQLGLDPDVRLTPSPEAPTAVEGPATAEESMRRAVANSPELAGLEATLKAKDAAVGAERGALYPRLDLVAQYALLARFNNYDEFFNRFQRHNGQVGMSLQVPIFAGKGVSASIGKAKLEAEEARLRLEARKAGVELESYRLFERIEQAQGSQKLAKLELDYARESLDVLLARLEEGRISIDEVERARVVESQTWERYYDSQYELRKARLDLLRRTGELAAMWR